VFSRSRVLGCFAALGAASSLALTGCASNSEGGGPTGAGTWTVSKDSSLASSVGTGVKIPGKMVVGVNVPYSPNEFKQGGKIVGFDVDLLDATAKVLGLTTEYREAGFDKIVPAVEGGTYDIGMSSFTDNKDREKTVDFVTYFRAGYLWAAPKGKTVDPTNACGLTVAAQSDTTEQLDELPALSKQCTDAGKKAIKVLSYGSQADATNAVVLGKADAMSADSPVTAYAIKQNSDKLVQAGDIREAAPYGWPIKKGSPLVQAMQKAVQKLMDDGTYHKICTKWGVQSGEIKTAEINAAVS
jgi:polar amino acid transport system substrate-binding protein